MKQDKIHRIVEYIRSAGVKFDAADVEEDVDAVLRQYGFVLDLSDEDRAALQWELAPMGLAYELGEVSRAVAAEDEEPLLTCEHDPDREDGDLR